MRRGLIVSLNHPDSRYEAGRVYDEAVKREICVDWVEYEDLAMYFNVRKKVVLRWKGKQFRVRKYGWVYFRPSHYGLYGDYIDLKVFLSLKMTEFGVRVMNLESMVCWPHFSKVIQHVLFSRNKLPVVGSWHVARPQALSNVELSFPLIVKKSLSSMGAGVFRVQNLEELDNKIKQYGAGNLLIQEYIPINEDYRVMILGGKSVGLIRRKLVPGSYLTNISAGGKAKAMILTREFSDLGEKVSRVCNLDHCGVDLIRDKRGELRVLEVNRHPQFKGFEKATGINVAGKIVEYLIQGK